MNFTAPHFDLIMGLGKRAKTSKLMHALEMETTEYMLLKRKLNFVKRLMINKFTRNQDTTEKIL
ncbi:hypothetical protein BpHYR1_042012, partial [Brachionus plicatilis]